MKNKVHVMVDIETLGTKEFATIFQVAAQSFHIDTGHVLSSIDLKLDISKVRKLEIDGDTLKWWLDTDKELLTKLLNEGDLTEHDMFISFFEWVRMQGHNEDVTLWGNGILFDNAKIKQKLWTLGASYPIHYKNDRDVRTILALAADKSGLTEDEIKASIHNEEEVAHNALDDVSKQIRLVCECYRLLMK